MGAFEDGNYSTKPGFGGNGVNHPTTIGLADTYIPALQEFVEDLAIHSKSHDAYLDLVPIQSILTTWHSAPTGTTNSGANIRYANAPLTDFPGSVILTKPDGARLVLRKDIQQFNDAVKLLAGEFATYTTAGLTQVVIAYNGSIEASYTLTAYYSA